MKFFLPLIEPLGIVWLLQTVFLSRQMVRRQRDGLLLPAGAWVILTLFTCTPLPSLLLGALEGRYPPVVAGGLPACDAIICLGGGASPSPPEPSGVHLKSAADRLPAALLLARMKKAPCLVLGGGGYKIHGNWQSEADALKEQFRTAIDPSTEIISLGLCADTHDEALKTSQLAKDRHWERILLVTSAYHMPRAMATFEHQGLHVIPVPCNYITSKFRGTERKPVQPPGHGGLESFSLWMHEVIGSWFYQWKGWTH